MTAFRVSGELAVIIIRVRVMPPPTGADPEEARRTTEDRLSRDLAGRERREQLQPRLAKAVRNAVGRNVEVDNYVVERSSIELLLILTATYKMVKDYNEFVDTLWKAAENARRVVRAVLPNLNPPPDQTHVQADLEVGTALAEASTRTEALAPAPQLRTMPGLVNQAGLTTYVLLTNIVLIVALLLMSLRGR